MRQSLLFLILFTVSCTHHQSLDLNWQGNQKEEYALLDMSGQYNVLRESKSSKNALISRQTLYTELQSDLPLEKTITVSKIGTIKSAKGKILIMRPEISQHTIWFEKQQFFSQLKVDPKSRKLVVSMTSPEEKWNGTQSFDFPKGRIFCFFTQLPACLKFYGFLKKNKKREIIVIIWDSFPYQGEQFRDIGEGPFQQAQIIVERSKLGDKKVDINLGNQIINYHFNKEDKFKTMFWIAQGITMKSSQIETEN